MNSSDAEGTRGKNERKQKQWMMREIGCRAKREDITRTHTIAGEN